MTSLVEAWVAAARRGENPRVITRMTSGWAVIGDVQTLPGYCLLLADPIVPSANALGEPQRIAWCLDMLRLGDAILAITGAARINYEILANLDPVLHAHVIPRYAEEPDDKRVDLAFRAYDWPAGRPFDPVADAPFMRLVRDWLAPHGRAP